MDTHNWNKRYDNNPKIYGGYIKSTTHRKIQYYSRHHILQRQGHCMNKYSIKQIYIQSNKTHSYNREQTNSYYFKNSNTR